MATQEVDCLDISRLTSPALAGPAIAAMVYLGQLDEAEGLVQTIASAFPASPYPARWIADIHLRRGSPQPIVSWRTNHQTGLPGMAEDRFARTLTGNSVAIIGPSADAETRDRLARNYDVLIDTKHLKDRRPPRTPHADRISYYPDSSLALFDGEIASELDERHLSFAVARPSFADSSSQISTREDFRIASTEDSLSFATSHFAISRIVYDVVRYAPAEIHIACTDLFTASTRYPVSYVADSAAYSQAGFMKVLEQFNHDVADDFVFLSGLRDSGLITADAHTTSVLTTSLSQYLDAVAHAESDESQEES